MHLQDLGEHLCGGSCSYPPGGHSVRSVSPTHKTSLFFFEGDYFLGLVLTCKAFWKLLEKSVNKCIGPE